MLDELKQVAKAARLYPESLSNAFLARHGLALIAAVELAESCEYEKGFDYSGKECSFSLALLQNYRAAKESAK